ncbi:MAG: DUF3343 domain-containing protein [Negativicutes bacterium]|nr:DUF3343 domain-containing protein [Negativicutes bacterium]
MKDRAVLYTFESVHQAIKGEDVLRAAGIACEMIPVPREISLSCGQGLRLAAADAEKSEAAWRQAAVSWQKKVHACRVDGRYRYGVEN